MRVVPPLRASTALLWRLFARNSIATDDTVSPWLEADPEPAFPVASTVNTLAEDVFESYRLFPA